MNVISCLTWIQRGVSNRQPERIKLAEDQIIELVANTQDENDTDDEPSSESEPQSRDSDDEDQVDEEEEDGEEEEDEEDISDEDPDDDNDDSTSKKKKKNKKSSLSMAGMSYYPTNKQDPHMSTFSDSSDEEGEILPDDNLLAIGKVNGDFCSLETYVYNEMSSSLYCHHDTILGACPLALEWVGYDPGESAAGNLLAVGSMEPDIELWDVDVINTLEPAFVLKGAQKKKGKKKAKLSSGHTDAVLDLAWNRLQQQVLASGSADFTLGLWDLDQGTMVTTIQHHTEKVQCLSWHPFEHQTLLSGSFDKTVKVYDCRTYDSAHKTWTLSGEVECVTWNKHDPFYFLASTDNGRVTYMDVRSSKPVYTFKAHDKAVTGVAISSELAGCMLTASVDNLVKVWDIRLEPPEMVFSKSYNVGEVHCLSPCPDSGCVFAVGGEHELKVIHLKTAEGVFERFQETSEPEEASVSAKVTGGADDSKDTAVKKKKKKKSKEVGISQSEETTKSKHSQDENMKVSMKKKSKKIGKEMDLVKDKHSENTTTSIKKMKSKKKKKVGKT